MGHRFLEVLEEHLKQAGIEPGLHHVEIRHDDECGIFEGRFCDCNPDILSGPLIDAKWDGAPDE